MPKEDTIVASITVDGNPYRVLWHALDEALFAVSTLTCAITQDLADPPDPATLMDKAAVLTLALNDGTKKRIFVGKVIEALRGAAGDEVGDEVRLTIAPDLWRLSKRADCRIFQSLSVTDVVKQVLTGAGFPAAQSQWKTTGSYPVRDYITQYRETDLEFVMRLLSEEGIYFSIVHADGKDNVVFGDNPKGLGDIDGPSTLILRDTQGFHLGEEVVKNVEQSFQVRSDKVMVRDYNPDKPSLKLDSKAEGTDSGDHSLEVYDYPARIQDKSVGDRYAKNLLTSMQAERQHVTGETGVLTMQPGFCFTIAEHPYAPLNQEYLIVSMHTVGRINRRVSRVAGEEDAGSATLCRFTAIPTSTSPYAPPRRDRARVVPGIQTAITTGPPPPTEIYTDAGGHVKAQFYWDRLGKKDDKSSCWMRTSQLPTGGSVLIPRMKWEVVVRFNEGDADRPYVMARMYNTASPPPYPLPANKARSSMQTATTPGGGSTNEFRFNDTKGSEEMMFNASHDMSVDVNNDTTESVGNNLTRQVGSNHSLSITNSYSSNVGANQSTKVGGNQTLNVSTMMMDDVTGAHSLSISGNRKMMIGGDHSRDVAADSALNVNASQVDVVVGSVTDHGVASFTHKVSGALVQITAANYALAVNGAKTENTSAIKLIASDANVGVQVGGSMNHKVAGAIINKVTGSRSESAATTFTEVAAGAHLVKAKVVAFEAEKMLSLVMGASTITLLPDAIIVAGTSLKLDGATTDSGAMVVDNI
jgi:type VI secretion system secreted protein VgrG